MKRLINAAKNAPKRTFVLLVAILAIAVPAVLQAWGPSNRPTYTIQNPADHVTFNSITNNPAYGDERSFAHIKEAGTAGSNYTNNINLTPGKTYDVFAYYHNNASSSLNDAKHNYKGIAQGAYMRVQFPEVVNTSSPGNVYVGASNANPAQVWDTITFNSTSAVTLRYVPDSAVLHNRGALNGSKLPNALFSNSGTAIGYNEWGKVPGCNEYDGYVTFQLKVDQPNFEINKQVRLSGQTTWNKTVAAKPGDKVEYMITYKNTGTVVQQNVVLKDTLPAGVTYVAGSSKLKNTTYPNGTAVSDNVVATSGINIGHYAPGGAAYLMFTAQVPANDKLATCGANKLTNNAHVSTDNGSDDSTADVTVDKDCPKTPVYTCDALGINKISRTKFEFSNQYTAKDGATYKNTTYVVKDKAGKEVARKTVAGNWTYENTTTGDYTVEAIVNVTVNGKDQTATDAKCKGNFTIAPENVPTCDVPGKEHLPKDDPNCKETPPVTPGGNTPSDLPTTGPGEVVGMVVGAGALTTAGWYYIASRRQIA